MGNCFTCFENKKKSYDHLITDCYCPQCQIHYISNYEYNKHIVYCNQRNGDL